MIDKPWTKLWINNFKNDPEHGHKRFKRLNQGHHMYINIDENMVDAVEFEEFITIEPDRIPILIGSQFGIYPNVEKMPAFFNGKKIIAILDKSLLSGTVAGVGLYEVDEHTTVLKSTKISYYFLYSG